MLDQGRARGIQQRARPKPGQAPGPIPSHGVPAQIAEEMFTKCQDTSEFLYRQLNCKGVVRFDYIFNDGGLYFLEVNTVPGMTEASIVPKMARAQGIGLSELFDMVLRETLGEG